MSSTHNETITVADAGNWSAGQDVAPGTEARDSELAKAEVAVQAVIFLVALFSNGIVLVALQRQLRRKPSSRMYHLMYHLSIADLLVAVLNILPQLIWDITHRFQGPDVLCRAVKFGQVFPLYLSSFVLTLMAVDRVGITGSGLRGVGMSSRATSSAIAVGKDRRLTLLLRAVWVASCLLAVPQLFIFSMQSVDNDGTLDCWATFDGKVGEKLYVVFFLFAVFFLPFVVITASYLVVTARIWRFSSYSGGASSVGRAGETSLRQTGSGCPSCEGDAEDEEDYEVHTMETGAEYEMKVLSGTSRGDSKSSTSTNNDCHKCHMNGQKPRRYRATAAVSSAPQSSQVVLLSRAKRKSLAMTAIVSVCFAVCWLPWCIAMMLLTFGVNIAGEGNNVHPILVILALLASLNSTTNPWIYLCFSSAVLQQVKHIMGLHSTYGGPDSLGGADADQENAILAKRVLFRKMDNMRGGQID